MPDEELVQRLAMMVTLTASLSRPRFDKNKAGPENPLGTHFPE